jgi:hypothetical protein
MLSITIRSLACRFSPEAEKFAAPVRNTRPSIWDGFVLAAPASGENVKRWGPHFWIRSKLTAAER